MKRFLCIAAALVLLTACVPQEIVPEIQPPVRQPSDNITAAEIFASEHVASDGDWPSRPITLIVPFLAGGETDLYARMLKPFLEEELGQTVTIVNIDGNTGIVGTNHVYTAQPDGYTVLLHHTGTMFTHYLAGTGLLTHHDFDIACVVLYCDANIMVIHSRFDMHDARDFLRYVRDYPNSLSVAVMTNTFHQLLVNLAEEIGGLDMEDINVGAGGLMAASLLNGHADTAFGNMMLFLPYIESGEMVPLWIAAEQRSPKLPDVPTLGELGIRGSVIGRYYFFAFPEGVDTGILRTFSAAAEQVTANPYFREELFEAVNLEPYFIPYNETIAHLSRNLARYTEFWNMIRD